MRCPDCNKFVSMEVSDPEVDTLEVDTDGTVNITVRIVRTCAECGTELKEATLEFSTQDYTQIVEDHIKEFHPERPKVPEGEGEVEVEAPEGEEKVYADEVELDISEEGVEALEETEKRVSYFGAEVQFCIKCESCNKDITDGAAHDRVAASEMEELS